MTSHENVLVDGIHGMVFGKLGEIPATYPQSKKLDGGFIFFYFQPYLEKIPILTSILRWVETTN